MVGLGIASFVDGMVRGYGIQQDMQDREEARKDREDERAWRDTQRGWAEEDRAFQISERERATSNREAIEAVSAETRAEFDRQVAAGTVEPDDYAQFWKDYALPKMQNELLMQGDIEGARKLMEWGESEDALKGGKLFAGAMFKAQTGDFGGALDDVIEAGKLGGYIAGDFDIDEKEPIQDANGTLIGYRITIRDEEGNETVQDIALDDVPQIIATFANPQAAWESQRAAAASKAERDAEIEDYGRKKEIDAKYAEPKSRGDAIKALRERLKVDPLVEGSQNFDDLPSSEQERLIQQEIDLQAGNTTPTPAPRRTIVDNSTGRPVPMPDPSVLDAAPGLGEVPTARQAPATPAAATQRGNAVINGVEDPGLPAVSTPNELVDIAAQQMVEGKNPQEIARTLRATNVPENMWPAELRRVISQ